MTRATLKAELHIARRAGADAGPTAVPAARSAHGFSTRGQPGFTQSSATGAASWPVPGHPADRKAAAPLMILGGKPSADRSKSTRLALFSCRGPSGKLPLAIPHFSDPFRRFTRRDFRASFCSAGKPASSRFATANSPGRGIFFAPLLLEGAMVQAPKGAYLFQLGKFANEFAVHLDNVRSVSQLLPRPQHPKPFQARQRRPEFAFFYRI